MTKQKTLSLELAEPATENSPTLNEGFFVASFFIKLLKV